MSLSTRLEDCRLGVHCRIETCNSYGSFVADAEAIFDLPAPVSSCHPDIVSEFTEQVRSRPCSRIFGQRWPRWRPKCRFQHCHFRYFAREP